MKESCLSPPWLARLHPSPLKKALRKTPIEFNKVWAGSSASKDLFAFSLQPIGVLSLVSACLGSEPTKPAQGHAGNSWQRERSTRWIPTLSLHTHAAFPSRSPSRVGKDEVKPRARRYLHPRTRNANTGPALVPSNFFFLRLAREINIEANNVRNVFPFFFCPRQCWKKNIYRKIKSSHLAEAVFKERELFCNLNFN